MSEYGLPRYERLRSLKAIRRVFDEGRGGFVYPLRYVALTQSYEVGESGRVEVLFSVPKKFHKRANKRNLLKRRMREAYRLNRREIVEQLESKGLSLDLVLIYSTKEIHSYKTIENAIQKVLGQVAAHI